MAAKVRKPETRARVRKRAEPALYLRFPDKAALARLEAWGAKRQLSATEAARRLIDAALDCQKRLECVDAYGLPK